jgi:hypothetical protein
MKRGSSVGRAEQAKRLDGFVGIPTAQNSIRRNKRRRQWLMIYAPVLTDGLTPVRVGHSYGSRRMHIISVHRLRPSPVSSLQITLRRVWISARTNLAGRTTKQPYAGTSFRYPQEKTPVTISFIRVPEEITRPIHSIKPSMGGDGMGPGTSSEESKACVRHVSSVCWRAFLFGQRISV